MANLINAERHKVGRYGLSMNGTLLYYAHGHDKEMGARREIFHSTSAQLTRDANAVYPRWRALGENVGETPHSGDFVAALHKAFMASEHHRYNILYPAFTWIGCGLLVIDGMVYCTQLFLG